MTMADQPKDIRYGVGFLTSSSSSNNNHVVFKTGFKNNLDMSLGHPPTMKHQVQSGVTEPLPLTKLENSKFKDVQVNAEPQNRSTCANATVHDVLEAMASLRRTAAKQTAPMMATPGAPTQKSVPSSIGSGSTTALGNLMFGAPTKQSVPSSLRPDSVPANSSHRANQIPKPARSMAHLFNPDGSPNIQIMMFGVPGKTNFSIGGLVFNADGSPKVGLSGFNNNIDGTLKDNLKLSETGKGKRKAYKKADEGVKKKRGRRNCPHNRQRYLCKDCGGGGICKHKLQRYGCKECGGSSICVHKRVKSQCKPCGGSGICGHNKRRSICKEFGGGSICQHKKLRYQCKDCGGSSICKHKKQRFRCKECGGRARGFCYHNKQKSQCQVCKNLPDVPDSLVTSPRLTDPVVAAVPIPSPSCGDRLTSLMDAAISACS